MRLVALVVGILVVAGAAPPVVAQPKPAIDRREQIKKKIRAIRAYTLTEELALDEQTAGKLFPLLARYDDELDKLVAARVEAHKRLVAAGASPDARAANKAVDDVLANQRDMRAAEERRVADFRKILSPQQVAKILVVLPAIDRKIQQQLSRAIRQAGKGGPGPRAGRPPAREPIDDGDDGDDGDDEAPAQPGPKPIGPNPPGPPAPTAPAKSFLEIQSTPPAHIQLDGVDVGETPIKVTVMPGGHKVTFGVAGNRYTFLVSVKPGETATLHKDLR